MPYRLNIWGLYHVEIPDQIHIGSRGFYIPIPHHRFRFTLIHAFVYFSLVIFIGYKIYTHKPSSFTVAQDGTDVRGDGFVAHNMTIRNSAYPREGAAVAFTSEANRTALHRCRLEAYQSTVYARYGLQFYRDCHVHGTVDIIFGRARALFQNCFVYAGKPILGHNITITAQGRSSAREQSAFSLQNCTIMANPALGVLEARKLRGFLGNPWRPFSTTVVMLSYLGTLILPEGWLQNKERSAIGTLRTVYYGEYGNRGPGANTSGRVKRPRYRPALTRATALNFTIARLIAGEEWLPSTGIRYTAGLM
ncbi:hypothetical protein H6P81_015868 [Aristolochia fimbriata]|uniref:Pectinesterase n=1 Tax=Aristolochia fimbriata TaxID=158543 RepID=A0AAV7EBB7_ARIFI|nr:hypothetical protein H6P81_015868 [Aristolochia fimbriata]